MYRFKIIFTALFLCLTLVACGEKNIDDKVVDNQTIIAEQSQENIEEAISDVVIDSEFKEAIDSYEDFFDEYISFMQKYSECDDPTSMMLDYISYLSKFTETMDKISNINKEELNENELAYYLEFNTRLLEKLATLE